MGAGAYHRENKLAIAFPVMGETASLLPEGAAIEWVLSNLPKDEPLAIATDSANILFFIQNIIHSTFWKSFTDHRY